MIEKVCPIKLPLRATFLYKKYHLHYHIVHIIVLLLILKRRKFSFSSQLFAYTLSFI